MVEPSAAFSPAAGPLWAITWPTATVALPSRFIVPTTKPLEVIACFASSSVLSSRLGTSVYTFPSPMLIYNVTSSPCLTFARCLGVELITRNCSTSELSTYSTLTLRPSAYRASVAPSSVISSTSIIENDSGPLLTVRTIVVCSFTRLPAVTFCSITIPAS